jgi:hypothetical protein
MARGWESKSVEEQMANPLELSAADPRIGFLNDEQRRAAEQHRAEHEREKQSLNLQRKNILSQEASHPARRAALEAALAQVEAQIKAAG